MLITAPGGTPVQVVPDHDQVIDLPEVTTG